MAFPKIVAFLLAGALSLPTPALPQIKQSKPEEPCWDFINNWGVGGFVMGFGWVGVNARQDRIPKGTSKSAGQFIKAGMLLFSLTLGQKVVLGVASVLIVGVAGRWIYCVWNKAEE